MEIHNISGCTAFSLDVDGKAEIDMDNNERADVIDNIYSWMMRHPDYLNLILQDLSNRFGEYKVLVEEPCECCGDIVTEMVLNLNE